ncbi:MAG: flagellin FliC [bacterium]|nr:flagellin FliC [bacterium]
MGIRINTNLASLRTQRHLMNSTLRVSKSLERLSSGLRINRAADDAAGLAISEGLKSDIRALDVATRNAADGISVAQTADGALDEISNILIRMRELAMNSATGTVTNGQRGYLDAEFQSLMDEISRIGANTEFNGTNLLDGSAGSMSLHVGIGDNSSSNIDLDLSDSFTAGGLGISTLEIASGPGMSSSTIFETLDEAMISINRGRANLGAMQNRLESTIRVNMNYQENLIAANSRIRDVDVAFETSELTRAQILQQMAVSVLSQANNGPQIALQLLGL